MAISHNGWAVPPCPEVVCLQMPVAGEGLLPSCPARKHLVGLAAV